MLKTARIQRQRHKRCRAQATAIGSRLALRDFAWKEDQGLKSEKMQTGEGAGRQHAHGDVELMHQCFWAPFGFLIILQLSSPVPSNWKEKKITSYK